MFFNSYAFIICKLGLLEVVMNKREEDQEPGEQLKVQARWYEKLHNWEQALSFYEGCLQKEPHDVEWSLGEMRWATFTKCVVIM